MMHSRFFSWQLGVGCVVFTIGWFGIAPPVRAMVVSPLRQTMIVKPGETMAGRIWVKNDEARTITVGAEVDAFTVDADSGHAVFGAPDTAKRWVEIMPKRTQVATGETKEIVFTFTVPGAAEPGAHYLALFVRELPGATGTVTITSRVGTLLYLYVAGSVTERMDINNFSADAPWYLHLPMRIFLQAENTGTIHTTPKGTMTLRRRNGQNIKEFSINEKNRITIPGTRFEESYEIQDWPWFAIGPITITAAVVYGVTNQLVTSTVTVWYLPWWLIGAALVVIAGMIFMVSKRKKPNIVS